MIVDVFDPWFTGHHGDPPLAARPHGLTSSGSCRSAGTSVVFVGDEIANDVAITRRGLGGSGEREARDRGRCG